MCFFIYYVEEINYLNEKYNILLIYINILSNIIINLKLIKKYFTMQLSFNITIIYILMNNLYI